MGAPLSGIAPIFAISFLGFSVGKKMQQDTPDQKLRYFAVFRVTVLAIPFPNFLSCFSDFSLQSTTTISGRYAGWSIHHVSLDSSHYMYVSDLLITSFFPSCSVQLWLLVSG